MKIFCVRIGDKYGPEYEDYIKAKLPYDIHFIREPFDKRVHLQWNKMYPMSLDINEPVCVIDIDMLFVNDYFEMFEYPIKRGQFVALGSWWNSELDINGGFFKYYPTDCRYIFDKFMANPEYWQRYYIDKGVTTGPVNGEQFFVYESVIERLGLIKTPMAWSTRWITDELKQDQKDWVNITTKTYREKTGNDYVFLGDEFHPDIKVVHFTNHINKPHEWSAYNKFGL